MSEMQIMGTPSSRWLPVTLMPTQVWELPSYRDAHRLQALVDLEPHLAPTGPRFHQGGENQAESRPIESGQRVPLQLPSVQASQTRPSQPVSNWTPFILGISNAKDSRKDHNKTPFPSQLKQCLCEYWSIFPAHYNKILNPVQNFRMMIL